MKLSLLFAGFSLCCHAVPELTARDVQRVTDYLLLQRTDRAAMFDRVFRARVDVAMEQLNHKDMPLKLAEVIFNDLIMGVFKAYILEEDMRWSELIEEYPADNLGAVLRDEFVDKLQAKKVNINKAMGFVEREQGHILKVILDQIRKDDGYFVGKHVIDVLVKELDRTESAARIYWIVGVSGVVTLLIVITGFTYAFKKRSNVRNFEEL